MFFGTGRLSCIPGEIAVLLNAFEVCSVVESLAYCSRSLLLWRVVRPWGTGPDAQLDKFLVLSLLLSFSHF